MAHLWFSPPLWAGGWEVLGSRFHPHLWGSDRPSKGPVGAVWRKLTAPGPPHVRHKESTSGKCGLSPHFPYSISGTTRPGSVGLHLISIEAFRDDGEKAPGYQNLRRKSLVPERYIARRMKPGLIVRCDPGCARSSRRHRLKIEGQNFTNKSVAARR